VVDFPLIQAVILLLALMNQHDPFPRAFRNMPEYADWEAGTREGGLALRAEVRNLSGMKSGILPKAATHHCRKIDASG
jgi:hypothetical protein